MELWRGVRGDAERKSLQFLEKRIVMLPIELPVWDQAFELLIKARASGLTAPIADVLIVAIAAFHGVNVEHCDWHVDALLKLL